MGPNQNDSQLHNVFPTIRDLDLEILVTQTWGTFALQKNCRL